MVSYPGYDLNKLSGTVDAEYWNKLINDQSEPLYDKATQVRIAPGSVYKLVTTSAGLEEGVIDSSEYINCIGTFDKLDHPRCWIARETGGEHGPLNIAGAIEQSCNIYFYEVGYRLSLNENLSRANHATFISYGPYNDPKISVTVAIPHGYMAYNAAVVCRYIYQYYFGYIDMEDILDKSYNTLGESATYSD